MSLDQKVLIIQPKKNKRRGNLAFKMQTSNEGSKTKEIATHIFVAFMFGPKFRIVILIFPRIVLMLVFEAKPVYCLKKVLLNQGVN